MYSSCSWFLLIILALIFLGMAVYLWGYFSCRLNKICCTAPPLPPLPLPPPAAPLGRAPLPARPYVRVVSADELEFADVE